MKLNYSEGFHFCLVFQNVIPVTTSLQASCFGFLALELQVCVIKLGFKNTQKLYLLFQNKCSSQEPDDAILSNVSLISFSLLRNNLLYLSYLSALLLSHTIIQDSTSFWKLSCLHSANNVAMVINSLRAQRQHEQGLQIESICNFKSSQGHPDTPVDEVTNKQDIVSQLSKFANPDVGNFFLVFYILNKSIIQVPYDLNYLISITLLNNLYHT